MRELLKSQDFPETDDCIVPVSGDSAEGEKQVRRLARDRTSDESGSGSKNDVRNGVSEMSFDDTENLSSGDTPDRSLEDGDGKICISTTGTYTARVNLYAGELGK